MKKILLYLVFCWTSLHAQKFKFSILPTDDASETRKEYKSLYNYSKYFIDLIDYKDSVIYQSDTNAVIFNDEDFYIKQFVGVTTIKIVNKKTKQLLAKKDLTIIDRPTILIGYDKTQLKNGNLSIKLIDDKGKNCSDKFYIAFIQYEIKDSSGKTIINGIITKFKTTIEPKDIPKAKTIKIQARLVSKENGLSSMAKSLTEDL